ncbi:g6466 [Coccomyxa viridis]|uniref:G6466 protein n=1 Tax=Coccomyxa viridis TaxID=1274662 RepID=A0ABP1FZE1_9CHLO
MWFASILFIARSLHGAGDGAGLPLTKILQEFSICIADFLKELPVIVRKSEPLLDGVIEKTQPLERTLKLRELQTSYVYTTVLAKKCRDLFHLYIGSPTTEAEAAVLRFTWKLFIVAKAKLFAPFPDLVASFNLLICVLAFVYCHVPAAQRAVPLTDEANLPRRNKEGAVDVLQSLAAVSKANTADVQPLMSKLDTLLRSLLADFSTDNAENEHHAGLDKLVLHCKHFPGLLASEGSLEQASTELDRTYEQIFSTISQIDERPFVVVSEPHLRSGSLPPISSMTRCQVGTPVRKSGSLGPVMGTPLRLMPSPLRLMNQHGMSTPSPVRLGSSSFFATPGMFAGTPVTEAMAISSWLQDLVKGIPAETSAELKGYMEGAGAEVAETVAVRMAELANAVFPMSPMERQPTKLAMLGDRGVSLRGAEVSVLTTAPQHGVKLFYRVLESMLKAEQDRTGRCSFGSLLSSASFHKCLAACCFEVVIASYRMVTHAFPAVLEKLDLPAFDMSKIISTFVRHLAPADQVPRELKRHLFSIEEKILEAQAWEKGSSLYPLLMAACSKSSASSSPADKDTLMEDSPRDTSPKGKGALTTPTKRERDGDEDGTPTKAAKPAAGDRAAGRAAAQMAAVPEEGAPSDDPEPMSDADVAACSPSRPDVPADVMDAAAALVSASSGGVHSPRGDRKGLLSPRRKSDTSAFQAFMTPQKRNDATGAFNTLPVAFGKANEAASDQPGRAVVSDFLNKVLKLAALRIADICERLSFEPVDKNSITVQVYTMVAHVITEQTNMMYGRHLDQVILCALYGVCKVNQLRQITFKDIITHYKKQAQAKNAIFRTVSIRLRPDLSVDQTGDVIEFYNAVFIPSTKAFLLQLGNGTANLLPLPTLTMPGTPLHGRLASNPYSLATPPPPDRATINKCLSPAGKVFVSPMRQPGQQGYIGARSQSTLSVRLGESSTAYSSPSKEISTINGHLSGRMHPQQLASSGLPASMVLQRLDPNAAAEPPPAAQQPPPQHHASYQSSERSTGSHASDHQHSGSGSRLSSEPDSSPGSRERHVNGAAPDTGLLNLAAAAEQGRLPNGVVTDSEGNGVSRQTLPASTAPSTVHS